MSSGPTLSKAERSKVKTRNPNGEPTDELFSTAWQRFHKAEAVWLYFLRAKEAEWHPALNR